MKHLGDITQIDWSKVPPVDCVTGGSPCQDLSQAGLRAGLAGERSGLFHEQIRCVKELRHADVLRGRTAHLIRPRYMVWENVIGAFSSNQGKDFQAVLTEIVRVSDPEAPPVPLPDKGWPHAGCLMGEGWSVAWRTHDAQYWGVPQRRRRVSVIADFGGSTAPEILFESASLPGNPQTSREERKATAGTSGEGLAFTMLMREGKDGGVKAPSSRQTEAQPSQPATCKPSSSLGLDSYNQAAYEEVSQTLRASSGGDDSAKVACYPGVGITSKANGNNPKPGDPCHTLTDDSRNYVVIENHPADSRVQIDESGKCQTLTSRMGTGGGQCASDNGNLPEHRDRLVERDWNGSNSQDSLWGGQHESKPDCYAIGNGQINEAICLGSVCRTLNCMHDPQMVVEVDNENGVRNIRVHKQCDAERQSE